MASPTYPCPCGFTRDGCIHCKGATVYEEPDGTWTLDELPGNHVAFNNALGRHAEFFGDVVLATVPKDV